MPSLRWLTAGLIPTAIIAVLVFRLLTSADATGSTSIPSSPDDEGTSSVAVVSPTASPTATSAPPSTATPTATGEPTVVPVEVIDPTPEATVTPTIVTTPTPAPAVVQATSSVRLTIASIGVNASVDPLAFDGAGNFAVPITAGGVGWYDFSARPGAPGNAVLGGHLNWQGSRVVFDRLDELAAGDVIHVTSGEGDLVYRVTQVFVISADAPFTDILGERSGPATLTLFTCGGTFDSASRDYDQRTVVNAVQISG